MSELTVAQREKLMTDLRVVISDAEELLRLTKDQAGEGLAELRVRINERLQGAKANLAQLQEAAVLKAKEASRVTDEYVHENPWTAVGAAVGLGMVLGLLLTGRR